MNTTAWRAIMDGGIGPGLSRIDRVISLSGAQPFEAMLAGQLPYPQVAKTLDFLLISARDGAAVFQGTPAGARLNPRATPQSAL